MSLAFAKGLPGRAGAAAAAAPAGGGKPSARIAWVLGLVVRAARVHVPSALAGLRGGLGGVSALLRAGLGGVGALLRCGLGGVGALLRGRLAAVIGGVLVLRAGRGYGERQAEDRKGEELHRMPPFKGVRSASEGGDYPTLGQRTGARQR